MAAEEITEAAQNPVIPYLGEVDLGPALIVALFVGLMLMKIIEPASENAAGWVSGQVESLTDFNPQTGQTGGNTAPIGGA